VPRDHIASFERWSKHLPAQTRDWVNLLLSEIVPLFTTRGFARHPDYAGGRVDGAGSDVIALQRRIGPVWPTVEIDFFYPRLPLCRVSFAELPEICRSLRPQGGTYKLLEVPRIEANVMEGRGVFWLCRSPRRIDFGHGRFVMNHERKLIAESAELKKLVTWLLTVFDTGIPSDWYEHEGQAAEFAYLNIISKCLNEDIK
jgi:hypothetical protein